MGGARSTGAKSTAEDGHLCLGVIGPTPTTCSSLPPSPRSTRAKQQAETGRIVNLMSTDVNQLMTFFYPFAAQLVTGPAMLIASVVLLWFQIK